MAETKPPKQADYRWSPASVGERFQVEQNCRTATELDFLNAIWRNPADDAAVEIYADWLEDQGRLASAEMVRYRVHIPGLVRMPILDLPGTLASGAVSVTRIAPGSLPPGWIGHVASGAFVDPTAGLPPTTLLSGWIPGWTPPQQNANPRETPR